MDSARIRTIRRPDVATHAVSRSPKMSSVCDTLEARSHELTRHLRAETRRSFISVAPSFEPLLWYGSVKRKERKGARWTECSMIQTAPTEVLYPCAEPSTQFRILLLSFVLPQRI